jgi:hypothetical protein
MSILYQATTCPGLQASQYTTDLALCLLGTRHDWASTNCARQIQQSLGGYRQVHQVDPSQVGYLPKGRQSTRLPEWTHASQRATPSHHHKLEFQLQQPSVLGILQEQRDRRPVRLSCPPACKRPSWARQQDGTQRPQEAIARHSCWLKNRTSPLCATHVTPRFVARHAGQSELLIDNGKSAREPMCLFYKIVTTR